LSSTYRRAAGLCAWPLFIQTISSGTPFSIAVDKPPFLAQNPKKKWVLTPTNPAAFTTIALM
jgi:hypothetical protein